MPRRLALAAAVGAAVAPMMGGAEAAAATAGGPPTRTEAWLARVVAPVQAQAHAGRGRVVTRVGTRARWNGGPVRLLVLRSRRAADGRRWLKVALPRRPNGSAGWIPADYARLSRTPWRIEIATASRTLRLLRRGRVVLRARVVVGARGTPTPTGQFAVNERVRQPNPRGFLGPWVLHLTAFSNVLDDFGGGPGRVGLHGRDGASLVDPLGSARSHGCIRVSSAVVRRLAAVAREGTPVTITRRVLPATRR